MAKQRIKAHTIVGAILCAVGALAILGSIAIYINGGLWLFFVGIALIVIGAIVLRPGNLIDAIIISLFQ